MPPRRRRRKARPNPRRRRFAILGILVVVCIFAARQDPSGAALSLGMTDVEALARVIRSEIGSGTREERLHVAWATRNLAQQRRQSVVQMACSPCGRQGRGRPVSSRQAARDEDRGLARFVLMSPKLVDPTGGATHFINPVLQDRLARSGKVPGYKGQTYHRVRRRWIRRYGWEPLYRLSPALEFWGRKRGN